MSTLVIRHMKIGIIDFGANDELAGKRIVENVIEYAQKADAGGFSRFWLTEHHSPNLGWSNPEMLLPVLAAATNCIKIGLAGTLAAVHSPYRIACSFKLLSSLYPDRIDLGFAKGRPSLEIARFLLNRKNITNKIYDQFYGNVKLICDFFSSDKSHLISPDSIELPEMWLLGSSYSQLKFARDLNIGFSKSLFHTNNHVTEDIHLLFNHKELFVNENGATAPLNLAFSGLCDADSQRAEKRFYDMYKFEYDRQTNAIVGSPAYFAERIEELREQTGIDEFIFKDLDVNNKLKLETLSKLTDLIKGN
jgi:alkanesulfonate monooxygenase SsuD/methylene tetrahydromethanopterin reductase-like flavin-dependent oxidoreductase (luciferase family)